jgi:hypothetical protein
MRGNVHIVLGVEDKNSLDGQEIIQNAMEFASLCEKNMEDVHVYFETEEGAIEHL